MSGEGPRGPRLLVDVRPINAHVDTGLGVYSYQLGRHLAAMCGHAVTFIQAPRGVTLGPNPPVRLRPPDFDLATDQKTLRTLAAAFGFDLTLSTYYPPPPSRRTPTVVVVQDLIPLRLPDQYRGTPVFDMYDTYLRSSCRGAAHVVAISEATRQDVAELFGLPERRITVVYPGADHYGSAQGGSAEGVSPRDVAGALAGRPFVLASCSTEPRKNLRGVLAAYARVRARLGADSPLLVLAGVGRGRRAEIQALVDTHGPANVLIAGRVTPDELAWLYRHAQCFVFPSLYEGFGLPVIEAMRMGTPVVCSDRTSLPEVGGDAVSYADPESPEDLSDKLLRLLADPALRSELVRRGMTQAGRFRWRSAAVEILQIVARVLGRPLSVGDQETIDGVAPIRS
jgi:glycosyltransferase involved in cell wall biosynthesis